MCQSLYEYINAENQRHVRRLQAAINHADIIAEYEDAANALGLSVTVSPHEHTGECSVWLFGDLSGITNKELDTSTGRPDTWLINGTIKAQQKLIV